MPPKKKADGKKSKTPPPQEAANPDANLLLLKIVEQLEGRITKYQEVCDHLTVTNTKYETELNQQISEKKDITDYLKRNLQAKGLEIYDLNGKLDALNEEKETEKQSFENQLRQLRQEFQETKDALSVENITLAGKLASLEEFKVQREDILFKMGKLESEIKENEVRRQEELYQLEKQNILNRHTLQKVTLQRLVDVSSKFREETNRQMAETTIRSIQENTTLSNDYKKLKSKCEAILEENARLKSKNGLGKMNNAISQTIRADLTAKNKSLTTIVKLLTEANKCLRFKIKKMQISRENEGGPSAAPDERDLEGELEELKRENSRLRADLSNSLMVSQASDELVAKGRSTLARISAILGEMYAAVREVGWAEGGGDVLDMLVMAISLINSAGVHDAETEEMFERMKSRPHEGESEEAREFKFSSPETKYYHYRLGDVGIVPMESDVFRQSVKQQKSRLMGNNQAYLKYLVGKRCGRETPD